MTGPPPADWSVDPGSAGATEVCPGLWRLRLPMAWPGIAHVNAYAIRREDGILLVDCGGAGHPSAEAALEVAFERAGLRIEQVSRLVLTHAHTDHCGLAAMVTRRSGAPLLAHPSADFLNGPRRDPAAHFERRAEFLRREGAPEERIPSFADVSEECEAALADMVPDGAISEGSRVGSELGEWEAIETPGHSPGHLCLLQRERGLAIVGDLICIAFAPWFEYGWSRDPLGETLASWARLDAHAPRLALPGHGRPIEDPAAVTAMHRERTEARLAATRELLAAGPLDTYALTIALHGEADDNVTVVHLTETLSDLRHLWLSGETERRERSEGSRVHALVD